MDDYGYEVSRYVHYIPYRNWKSSWQYFIEFSSFRWTNWFHLGKCPSYFLMAIHSFSTCLTTLSELSGQLFLKILYSAHGNTHALSPWLVWEPKTLGIAPSPSPHPPVNREPRCSHTDPYTLQQRTSVFWWVGLGRFSLRLCPMSRYTHVDVHTSACRPDTQKRDNQKNFF